MSLSQEPFMPSITLLTSALILFISITSSPIVFAENNDAEDEAPMDWSQPAVSRGFAQGVVENADEIQAKAFKSGQVAYFFGDYKTAMTRWLPLAEAGMAEAQASVGWLCQAGLGMAKDLAQALAWYRKAALQGHAVAQNNLGALYEQGEIVEKDLDQAMAWYRRAAEQGYRFAQFNLAQLHVKGPVAKQDLVKARYWLSQAAHQGVSEAEKMLKEIQTVSNTLE